jgi:hypothetical protein
VSVTDPNTRKKPGKIDHQDTKDPSFLNPDAEAREGCAGTPAQFHLNNASAGCGPKIMMDFFRS